MAMPTEDNPNVNIDGTPVDDSALLHRPTNSGWRIEYRSKRTACKVHG